MEDGTSVLTFAGVVRVMISDWGLNHRSAVYAVFDEMDVVHCHESRMPIYSSTFVPPAGVGGAWVRLHCDDVRFVSSFTIINRGGVVEADGEAGVARVMVKKELSIEINVRGSEHTIKFDPNGLTLPFRRQIKMLAIIEGFYGQVGVALNSGLVVHSIDQPS